jgi:O-antigen/teichoic acid export membrane protein
VTVDTGAPAAEERPSEVSTTARQIRGSALLFTGRMLALAINLVTQVVIVRLLSKGDYGAFAYALSITASARLVVGLGHQQVLPRFLALYEEERAYGKLFGTLVMEAGTILTGGLLLLIAVNVLDDTLAGTIVSDPEATAVLAILILLAPLDALDQVFDGLFAVFSRPWSIFVRKYMLIPGLRLVGAMLLLVVGSSPTFLAAAYVVASAVGVVVYTLLAFKLFRRRGLLRDFRLGSLRMPFREVFGFAAPLLSTQLVYISINAVGVALLGYFDGTPAVAEYRAVYPAAQLNQLVLFTFTLLFVPLAARLYARGDAAGMQRAYWQTAAWVAVISFPVFALTGPLAEPTTVTLFGDRYRDAAVLLALLSSGYYFNAALGFNALTLQTYGKLRYIFTVNIAAAILNVLLSLVLIPPFGAVGVAIAAASTLVLQNVLFQAGLGRGIGVTLFERRYWRMYAVITAGALALAAVELGVEPPAPVAFALAALVAAVVFVANRDLLEIETTFPELRRVPLLGRLVR